MANRALQAFALFITPSVVYLALGAPHELRWPYWIASVVFGVLSGRRLAGR